MLQECRSVVLRSYCCKNVCDGGALNEMSDVATSLKSVRSLCDLRLIDE
jgi:hypothetical protein